MLFGQMGKLHDMETKYKAKLQQYDDMEAKYKAQLHDMHKTENQKQAEVDFFTTGLFLGAFFVLLGIFCGFKLRN